MAQAWPQLSRLQATSLASPTNCKPTCLRTSFLANSLVPPHSHQSKELSVQTRLDVRCGRHGGSLRRSDPRTNTRNKKRPGKGRGDGGAAEVEEDIMLTEDVDRLLVPKIWTKPVTDLSTIMSPKLLAEVEQLQLQEETRKKQPEAAVVRSTHKTMKVMSGSCQGRKLLSPRDKNVRPMMEVVRGAVFSMLQALCGSPGGLPPHRWLDLYSGTGAVGIEALSRGCISAHFVESDPWVVANVLGPNLDETKCAATSVIHTARVENILEQVLRKGDMLGGPFDFISVTPPYEAVVYKDLMAALGKSPLISESSCMIVEYPLKSRDEMLDRCGPLFKIRDRRYGRTNIAVYGPEWSLTE